MPSHNPTSAEQTMREQLVAYLDGELPPAEARALEAKLGSDQRYQQELQSLEKTWDALDQLPRPTAGKDFSRTTLEMATIEAQQEVAELTAAMPIVRRRRRWVGWAAVAASMVLGFLLARTVANSPNRELARDLPAVWQVDALIQAPSGAFLARLADEAPDLIAEHQAPDDGAVAAAWRELGDLSLSQRLGVVRKLSAEQKSQLQDSQSRFKVLAPKLQDTLRDRYASFSAELQDTPRVFEAALAYNKWAGGQTPEVQAQLRSLDSDEERLAKIAKLHKREQAMSRRKLTSQDASNLRRAVRELSQREEVRRLPEQIKQVREQRLRDWSDPKRGSNRWKGIQDWGERFDRAMQNYPAMPIVLLSRFADADDLSRRWERMLLGPRADEFRDQAKQDWRVVEPVLTAALSDKARQALGEVPRRSRSNRLREWVLESAVDAMKPDNLEEFFASDALSDVERNKLLAMPREEMYKGLRSYYFDREIGLDPSELPELGQLLRDLEGRSGRPPGPSPPNRGPKSGPPR